MMNAVSPAKVLAQVAAAVPPDCKPNIVIIGSLAAGYHFFANDKELYVRTKDIDSVLRPREKAVISGEAVASELIRQGWQHREDGNFSQPGDEQTPTDRLPAVRLHPPGHKEWFIELLTLPAASAGNGTQWLRLKLPTGHYGLPSFTYLPLSAYQPVETEFGIFCARAEMMALANLLEHPAILPGTMSSLIAERAIKRSNKDLGRALALARLSGDKIDLWPELWRDALQACFPRKADELRTRIGRGLRALRASPPDLEEAMVTCNYGLLATQPVDLEQFTLELERVLRFVIAPLEKPAPAT